MQNEHCRPLPGRRQFLLNVLPSAALFCLGCGSLAAAPFAKEKSEAAPGEHKFLADSQLSWTEVFRFAYQFTYIPLLKRLADTMGPEKFIAMLKTAMREWGDHYIKDKARDFPRRNLADFFSLDYLEGLMDMEHRERFWSAANTSTVIENKPKAVEMKITECLWAQTFREADAAAIGFASVCYFDKVAVSAFDPKLKLIRPKTLMEGGDCCNFRWVWEG